MHGMLSLSTMIHSRSGCDLRGGEITSVLGGLSCSGNNATQLTGSKERANGSHGSTQLQPLR